MADLKMYHSLLMDVRSPNGLFVLFFVLFFTALGTNTIEHYNKELVKSLRLLQVKAAFIVYCS